MAVNKGLKTILESSPNFSNQALENAINDIKAIDQDDGHQFILSQFLVDEAIRDNTVLTTSQKNDALEAIIAAQPHLQIGRILSDLVRHTASQIDGSMMTATDDVSNPVSGTFLEMLQFGSFGPLFGTFPKLFPKRTCLGGLEGVVAVALRRE